MEKEKSKKASKSLSTRQRTIIVVVVLGLISFFILSFLGLCGICAFLTPSSKDQESEEVAGVATEVAPTNLEIVNEIVIETTDDSILIEGYVDTSASKVMVNETEASLENKDGKKYFSASMPLEVGTNEFIVISYNQNGEKDEERKVIVTREKLYKVMEVVDGDTIKIDYDGKTESVRLIGIDTPENKECFNQEATNRMKSFVKGKEVRIEFDQSQGERDKYNRLLLYVWQGSAFINDRMIRDGYAHEYTYNLPYEYMDQFKEAEKEARENKWGLWGDVCACKEGEETGRTCIACHTAQVTRTHWDCSTYTEDVTDNSCTSGCYVAPAPEPEQEKYCCKICTKGKACGDSCINKNYTCHQPPGCACDG